MKNIFYISLFFMLTSSSLAQTKTKDLLFFQVINGRSNGLRSSSTDFYFYQSGRIDCQKSQRAIQKNTVGKKYKCFQITPAKITELVKLAEEADFRDAKAKYMLYKGGIDWGNWAYIIYFNGKNQKEIKLDHTEFELESIPYSMQEFLRKIGEIDKTMKIQFDFPKPDRNRLPQDFL